MTKFRIDYFDHLKLCTKFFLSGHTLKPAIQQQPSDLTAVANPQDSQMSPRLITASSDMANVRSECRTSLRRNFDSTGLCEASVLGLYRRCSGLKTLWL